MPLYEYECSACKRHTEKIQKFSDREITVCPHCGGTLTRVISAPAFSFAGGGWYADGYGSKRPAGSGDVPAAPASGESAPAAAASTPAPAAKPAAATPAPAAPSASKD